MSQSVTFSEEKPTKPGLYWIRPKKWIDGFSGYQVVSVVPAEKIYELRHWDRRGELAIMGIDWGRWRFLSAEDGLLFSIEAIKEPKPPRACKECGKSLYSRAAFCSPTCRTKAWRRENREKARKHDRESQRRRRERS